MFSSFLLFCNGSVEDLFSVALFCSDFFSSILFDTLLGLAEERRRTILLFFTRASCGWHATGVHTKKNKGKNRDDILDLKNKVAHGLTFVEEKKKWSPFSSAMEYDNLLTKLEFFFKMLRTKERSFLCLKRMNALQ